MLKVRKTITTLTYALLLCSLCFVVFLFITSRTNTIFGLRTFVVLTGSMEPALSVGSVVIAQPQSEYGLGDVISYALKEKTITHRVVSIRTTDTGKSYIVKGDANKTQDTDPVIGKNVIGKVTVTIPFIGVLIEKIRSPLGFVSFVVIPGLIAVLYEVWVLMKEHEKIIEKRLRKKFKQEMDEVLKNYLSVSQTSKG